MNDCDPLTSVHLETKGYIQLRRGDVPTGTWINHDGKFWIATSAREQANVCITTGETKHIEDETMVGVVRDVHLTV